MSNNLDHVPYGMGSVLPTTQLSNHLAIARHHAAPRPEFWCDVTHGDSIICTAWGMTVEEARENARDIALRLNSNPPADRTNARADAGRRIPGTEDRDEEMKARLDTNPSISLAAATQLTRMQKDPPGTSYPDIAHLETTAELRNLGLLERIGLELYSLSDAGRAAGENRRRELKRLLAPDVFHALRGVVD